MKLKFDIFKWAILRKLKRLWNCVNIKDGLIEFHNNNILKAQKEIEYARGQIAVLKNDINKIEQEINLLENIKNYE